eukprot:15215534-Alexandrium_andersonii.AAC.1
MAAGDTPVCFQARKVLRLSAGRRRIPLEELAPAKFNRHGTALSGRHIQELAMWCHTPDPDDPLSVANDANPKACLLYTSPSPRD